MKRLALILFVIVSTSLAHAQKETLAVLNIDISISGYDSYQMGNVARIYVEKNNVYYVMDKYDINQILRQNGIEMAQCYGSIALTKASKYLNVNKILTGSIEKIDKKVVISLRLFSTKSLTFEKVSIKEYIDIPELGKLLELSVNDLLGLPSDPKVSELVAYYDNPLNSPKLLLRLNGPRMGVGFIGGKNGEILQMPTSQGGFDVSPLATQIGYQFEKAYLTSGSFMGLIECIPMVAGLEQGRFIPLLLAMNGFRNTKTGIELAFGPMIQMTRIATGYYENGQWHLEQDWMNDSANYLYGKGEYPVRYQTGVKANPNPEARRLDSRGKPSLVASWVWAIGKTFRSGYLNIPVNVYFTIDKNGWMCGTSFGFNANVSNNKK